jgi:hypothetical protein
MKKQLLVSCASFACLSWMMVSFASQQDEVVICPMDVTSLSHSFEKNWERLPERNYFGSYVLVALGNHQFTGALHTLSPELPNDVNPHLSYAQLKVTKVAHYGVWNIDCQYRIGSAMMSDLDDGYLHMTTTVDVSRHCKKVDAITTVCSG